MFKGWGSDGLKWKAGVSEEKSLTSNPGLGSVDKSELLGESARPSTSNH